MTDPFKPQEKRPVLGRGLNALIPEGLSTAREAPTEIDIDLLRPNPRQPRAAFDEAKLDELAASIKSSGVIQPVLVRRHGGQYEIVAGERRWRAAQRAGLLRVPVVVRDVPDNKMLEVALIENIQRENLNPIDEAQAYRKLIDELHLTQEDVASAVGKDRTSVSNYLRLLKLPDFVRQNVADGTLSMGHARALLGLESAAAMEQAARAVMARNLSVRATESLVARQVTPRDVASDAPVDVHTRSAEERLRFALGTRVRIVRKQGGGRIEIDFVSDDELNRLFEQLTAR